ncbi:hypothetical protein [Schumannella soli]|uniref:DUF1440 domain-containing protein n=1 Tax=Schumannella soli TaxID=2590779 RepID=A0A506YAL2_9MICO|nr:hypothetical protein [Schumannella soli]TPW77509.1 hypothetical protein FJ657_02165 [Schumannella soli]
MRLLARGAVAGAAATLPMTAVLLVAQRRGALEEPPPFTILRRADRCQRRRRTGTVSGSIARRRRRERAGRAARLHLAIGAISGAVYGLLGGTTRPNPASAVAHGVAHGLGVWLAGYAVTLPLAGLYAPAWADRPRRVRSIVAAHLVYGAVLGLVARRK